MYKLCGLLLLLIGLVALISGCGGGGGGGDDDGGIDPSTSMIGTWQPISATQDGTATKVLNVMPETNEEPMRWEMEFSQNGTCSFRAYRTNGTLIEAIDGTWSSDNQIAPVVIDGDTTEIHWSDFGNVMTATYTIDGHAIVAKWVRLTIPTQHETFLVGNWQAQSLELNGASTPLGNFFEWSPGSTAETLDLQSNGTAVFQELADSTVVDTLNETWSTGQGVVKLTYDGSTLWGYWNNQATSLVLVLLDPLTGNTVKLIWNPLIL